MSKKFPAENSVPLNNNCNTDINTRIDCCSSRINQHVKKLTNNGSSNTTTSTYDDHLAIPELARKLFECIDEDNNGTLDKEELKLSLEAIGFDWINDIQMNQIFEKADYNHNGVIEYEEFQEELSNILGVPIATAGISSSSSKRIENLLNENEFRVNNHIIHLPTSGKVTKEVAIAMGQLLLHAARHGIGENTKARGMLILAGSLEDFADENFGYVNDIDNKFREQGDIYIQKWTEHSRFILPCFIQDGALFIDGESGKILADRYSLELNKRCADQNGGEGHRSASAVGMKGCLAMKCSEDSCMTDGQGKGELKVFPGQKEPIYVDIPPQF